MNRIESVVAGMPYEKAPYFPYQYPQEVLSDCEALVGRPFPDDVRWYLTHVGWRKIDYDHRSILVRDGEYIYELRFEAAEHQAFCQSSYTNYLERNEGGRLPHNPKLYFPIGKIEGEINPPVTFRLLLNLNDEGMGSIWGVRPIGYQADQAPYEPIRIADDLASFLEQIGSTWKLQPVARKNNEALFEKLVGEYLEQPKVVPTSGADAAAVIRFFFDHREQTLFDGGRNVEFQHYANSQRYETAAHFEESARTYAENLPKKSFSGSTSLVRREIRIGEPVKFDRYCEFDRRQHTYFAVPVVSTIGEGLRLNEEFLLYHDQPKKLWTIVRRLMSAIDEVKVKGLGTLAFDSTHKWQLKKKVIPAWSEVKAALHIDGEEDALTGRRIDFAKQIIEKADFRPVFEAYVFKLYQERYYPEFEAMPDDEKKDWAKAYPNLESPQDTWLLFGKKAAIHVEDDTTFSLHVDAGFDPEHGLSVRVRDWHIV